MAGETGRARGGAGAPVMIGVAGLVSSTLLLSAVGSPVFAAVFLVGFIAAGALVLAVTRGRGTATGSAMASGGAADVALARALLDQIDAAAAITDAALTLVAANGAFERAVGMPDSLARVGDGARLRATLEEARARGGGLCELELAGQPWRIAASPVPGANWLLWRFSPADDAGLLLEAERLIAGEPGRRLGQAGIMAVLAGADGHVRAANPVFAYRAAGDAAADLIGGDLAGYLGESDHGQLHFIAEGRSGPPLRIFQVPLGSGGARGDSLFLLVDDHAAARVGGEEGIHVLLEHLPLGLALADADGRFTFMNRAFRRAAGLGPQEQLSWPGDLVVDEDKSAVSDIVRRFARGRGMTGDLAVRLRASPDEPISLTVAGARGLGSAAVLLSLKDNSEEARLRREIAQTTKMHAVGKLAGGVAHDFNNILTAILGTCDMMAMRHMPGDPDYDDIQQIRSNSNRAANLTRQLLAFSRQQTLRPQVLQLPDVVSEVSHLLHRLLGDGVRLQVKHGRNLGTVRADPGQLEQVIVNLAVNARDAILSTPAKEGVLKIETFAFASDEVRRLGSDVMPVGDYTGLRVTDTGTGIPPHVLSKIFEPFFTTKEVGKGTGLGLSTVYGIIKQSGGFIFAETEQGQGTCFTIYMPVHHAPTGAAAAAAAGATARPRQSDADGELWGSGTILLVEDEGMVRNVAERALTRHGYTVLCAESGEAALDILAEAGEIDLMISDVMMPNMDGPTTVRAARRQRPDIRVLFMSGYAEEQLRKSIDIDNVSFLPKPFSVRQLAETVRDELGRK